MTMPRSAFRQELTNLLNRHSRENDSGTPDYLLAAYLSGCLENFEIVTRARDKWWGFKAEVSTPGEDD